MAILAIKGHATKGKEVIEILKMLGGKNNKYCSGGFLGNIYFINKNGDIETCDSMCCLNYFRLSLEDFLEKFPYKVGDKVYNIIHNENQVITKLSWDAQENEVVFQTDNNEYVYVNYLQPYKEKTMEEKTVNHVNNTDVISFDNAQNDIYELDLKDKFHVILREGKYYVERIKPKYPKTYEECCKVFGLNHHLSLGWNSYEVYTGRIKCLPKQIEDIAKKLESLSELLICRDSYWKIAGEEMGLKESWEPDWKNPDIDLYVIINVYNRGEKAKYGYGFQQCVLTFPTEEM